MGNYLVVLKGRYNRLDQAESWDERGKDPEI